MASSICGYYGSEQINTDEYLRRFIDLEYSMPIPSSKVFCDYLYQYYNFDEFFSSDERKRYTLFNNDKYVFLKIAEMLFNKNNSTLRQQEKIFAHSRLVLKSFKLNNYTFSHLLFFLIYIKNLDTTLYNKIENQLLTLQELSDSFSNIIDSVDDYELNVIYIQALLLVFYNNSFDYGLREELLVYDHEGNRGTLITSKLETPKSRLKLLHCIEDISYNNDYSQISLNYLLKKINLTETIKV